MEKRYKGMLLLIFVFIITQCAMQENTNYGIFEQSTDVGNVKHKGITLYDPATEQYTITGSGANMWLDTDEFHFTWKRVEGDFILYAMIDFLGEGVDPHRKGGLIIRKDLDPSSPYISAAYHGDGLVAMQYRLEAGAETLEINHEGGFAPIMQLERTGNSVVMSAAKLGDPLQKTGEIDFGNGGYYVGLFVCSHNADVKETAIFSNTRLTIPVSADFRPYQDFLGSRVEILDIETGLRKVIYETPDNLEAPNWSKDGKFLVVNGRGILYRIEADGSAINEIDTDFATSNNNDHGISPDGTQLVISHHVDDLPPGQNSIIFTLPIEGGTPTRVTQNGPSYWHGWSPDGKYLIYTGNRNGQWDIYRIPVEGGEEIQLTNSPGLDDGSEYSYDGKYIWFNSVRSGSMEIWRMDADGGNPIQITNDEYQNWFPHPSPDDSQIIFLSYLPDVAADDHPYYKQVMLRIMNTTDLQPRVIAHLYGGQGTINVPSWSPDGKKVAFVSNSLK